MDELSNNDIYVDAIETLGNVGGDDKKIRSLTWALWALIVFIMGWFYAILISVEIKTDALGSEVVYTEIIPGNVTTRLTNAVTPMGTLIGAGGPTNIPHFTQEKSYNIGDIVTIKHFNVSGVVIEKIVPGGDYIVAYKNHEHSILTVSLPVEMLLKPMKNMITPFDLMD